jgi:P-type Mg2+ transporter
MLLPVTPVGRFLGFQPLPAILCLALLGILAVSVMAAEIVKEAVLPACGE